MLTRCPACATHFRVTAEQLKIRSGRVRCGACQHVFNALDSLLEEPAVVAAPAAPGITTGPAPAPDHPDLASTAPATATAVAPAPTPEPVAETSAPPRLPARDVVREAVTAADPMPGKGGDTPAPASPGVLEPSPPSRRWPWAIGSLVAFAVLALQAALAFRVELAQLWPQAKPALVALCQYADCEVGLPAKVAMVGIEASDLHPDKARPGRLELVATLKNRAPFAQQYPHLELTLTDTADQAIARKVLVPADYLPPATAIARGMPANADIVLSVGIELREMAASGYRLYLFYP